MKLTLQILGIVYPLLWVLKPQEVTGPGEFAERFLFGIVAFILSAAHESKSESVRKLIVPFGLIFLFSITYHSIYRCYTSSYSLDYTASAYLVFFITISSITDAKILFFYAFFSIAGNLIASSLILPKAGFYQFFFPALLAFAGGTIMMSRKISDKNFLLLSEEFIQKNLDREDAGIFLTDSEEKIQFINENAKKIIKSGFRDDFILGSKIIMPVPPEARKLGIPFRFALEGDIHFEVRYVKAEWKGHPCFLVVLKDVTEEERRNREKEKQRIINENVLKHTGEGIIFLNTEGFLEYINPEGCRLLGMEREELVGEFFLAKVHHTDLAGNTYEEENFPPNVTYTEGKPFHISFDIFWRKDGSHFYTDYTSTPVFINEKLEGAILVFRDVTERKEKEDAEKKYTDDIMHLSLTSNRFLEIYTEPELYRFIADEAGEIAKSAVIVNVFDEETGRFTTKATRGFEKLQNELHLLLGRDLKDLEYFLDSTDPALELNQRDAFLPLSEGLFSLKYGNLNHRMCIEIERLADADRVYNIIISYKDIFMGNIILLANDNMPSSAMMQIFQNQASINLHRRLLDKNLQKEKFRFDPLIQESSILYCELRTDGTVLFINPSFEKVFHYTNEEITGKNFWNTFLSGSLYSDVLEFMNRVKENPLISHNMDMVTKKSYQVTVKWDWIYKYSPETGEETLTGLGLEITV